MYIIIVLDFIDDLLKAHEHNYTNNSLDITLAHQLLGLPVITQPKLCVQGLLITLYADESTIDQQEGVSRGPPMRARHGTHQVETLPAAIGHVLDVLRPREVTVEDDSQELD